MSSSAGRGRGRGGGRGGNKPQGPLRKPGEFTTTSKNQSLEDSTLSPKDEKPPVSTVKQSAKDDSSLSLEPLAGQYLLKLVKLSTSFIVVSPSFTKVLLL